jgi:hypothetical protein
MIPSHDEDGNITGAIIIQNDITEDIKKQKEIQVALMKEKSDIFIKTKDTFAKNNLQINELENFIKQLQKELNETEVEKEKYLLLLDKYKDDVKILKSKVDRYEKEDVSNIKGINIIKIQKENATLNIEMKKLRDNMEKVIETSQRKINQIKIASNIEIDQLEKELEKCKGSNSSLDSKVLSQKLEFWKEKAKEETQRIEELEKRVMQLVDSNTLAKIFNGK